MKPPRQDKEPVGLGASVIVAVAGVIVAGLGLVTMRSAFPPMPKADTPVVVTHPDPALANAADHVRPPVLAIRALRKVPAEEIERARRARARLIRIRHRGEERLEIHSRSARAVLRPVAPPAAAPQKLAALSAPDDGKLCKAPSPNEVTTKALQPGLILRYDARFRTNPIDIPPPRPPSDEERRLKLSALLADILKN